MFDRAHDSLESLWNSFSKSELAVKLDLAEEFSNKFFE
jgi:hypothetical protein